MRSKFSCVRSSHDLCARAHAHSLEEKLNVTTFYFAWHFSLVQSIQKVYWLI